MPLPVLRRLPGYHHAVAGFRGQGREWVSSQTLGRALGLTSSTVRQDLSHLDLAGTAKRGYPVGELDAVLRDRLGSARTHRVVIVGAGMLGSALAEHGELATHGFRPVAILDRDPERVGQTVGGLTVKPIEGLGRVVKSTRAELGVVAVPSTSAQAVADLLVAAGVRGLLNLSYANLRVPPRTHVVNARFLAGLQELVLLGKGSGVRGP